MSARRIIHRREYLADNPIKRRVVGVRADRSIGSVVERLSTYHDHEIKVGRRHPSFQKTIRGIRVANGLEATSTNMHKVYGKSY